MTWMLLNRIADTRSSSMTRVISVRVWRSFRQFRIGGQEMGSSNGTSRTAFHAVVAFRTCPYDIELDEPTPIGKCPASGRSGWSGDRVVDCAALEMLCTGNRTEGSNPSRSAGRI